jgi:hypothetical protein
MQFSKPEGSKSIQVDLSGNFIVMMRLLRFYLLIAFLGGMLALCMLFAEPSMDGSMFLLGFSALRVAWGGIILVLVSALIWANIKAWRDERWISSNLARLETSLDRPEVLLPLVVWSAFLMLTSGLLLYLPVSPLAPWLGMLLVVVDHSFGVIIWVILLAAALLVILLVYYVPRFRRAGGLLLAATPEGTGPLLFNAVLLPLVLIGAAFHWSVYFFRLEAFTRIKGWFWIPQRKPFGANDLLFFVLLVGAGLVVWWLVSHPKARWRTMLGLVGLGYLLQVGFGFIDGGGFEALRQKYIHSDHRQYARMAAEDPGLVRAVVEYETYYGEDYYMGTKPPGVLVFYILADKTANLFRPEVDPENRYERSTRFAAYAFPLVAALTGVVLFLLAGALLPAADRSLPAILYALCANFILFPLYLDQVLYPLLAAAIILLVIWAAREVNLWLSLAAGALFYLALFTTFSLLPLAPLVLLWIGVEAAYRRGDLSLRQRTIDGLKVIACIALGMMLMWLLFWWSLEYDPLARYSHAMVQHRAIKQFEPGWAQLWQAAVLNNVEFAVWVGFPIILLIVARVLKAATAFIRLLPTRLDWLTLTFGGMYAALNMVGSTKGEVGRLWIFLLPLAALLAGAEVRSLILQGRLRRRILSGMLLLLSLQLVTTYILFKFQDLNGLLFK